MTSKKPHKGSGAGPRSAKPGVVRHLVEKHELPAPLVKKIIEQEGPSRERVGRYLQRKRNDSSQEHAGVAWAAEALRPDALASSRWPAVSELVSQLRARLPREARLAVDEAQSAKGSSFVDVSLGERRAVIELRPDRGFGLSSLGDNDGFGEGPDESYATAREVVARLVAVLQGRQRTVPPAARPLQKLRSMRGLTQADLADRMQIRQPTLSELENRDDCNLSTLRRYVEALGGELVIEARFKEATCVIDTRAAIGGLPTRSTVATSAPRPPSKREPA